MKMHNLTKMMIVPATLALSSNVFAAAEQETGSGQNDTIATAEQLGKVKAMTIQGSLGMLGDRGQQDTDFFAFSVNAGDVLTFDIDGGIGGQGNLDTDIAIYDPSGVRDALNRVSSLDEGSTSTADPKITKWVAKSTGTYTVAVGNAGHNFYNGGTGAPIHEYEPGDYSLVITSEQPSATQINFEVKPGVSELAPLKPSSKGKIPVAIYGSDIFNVSEIKQDSLTFGSTGNEKSLSKCNKVSQDLNKDGYKDLLCHFENSAAGFKSGDETATMKGMTKSKKAFKGNAQLKVIQTKRN